MIKGHIGRSFQETVISPFLKGDFRGIFSPYWITGCRNLGVQASGGKHFQGASPCFLVRFDYFVCGSNKPSQQEDKRHPLSA
jgi:hypothetical protein